MVLTGAGMAAGPGLIWQMAYVHTGMLLLHAGLHAALILLCATRRWLPNQAQWSRRGGRVAGAVSVDDLHSR